MKADRLLPAARTLSEAGGATIGMVVGIPAAIIVGAVLTSLRWAFNSVNAALVFMILVVALAAIGGRVAGVITAVASTMSFDFFHTQPYLSMTIDKREDIETTVLLFVAALIVGGIATNGRIARRREASAHHEVRRIHRVAEAAASGWPPAVVLATAQDEITELLDLADCRFEALPYSDLSPRSQLGRNGAIEQQSTFRFRRDREGRSGFEFPPDGLDLRVLARGDYIGRFVLVPKPHTVTSIHHRIAAVAIADQVGAMWTTHTTRPAGP